MTHYVEIAIQDVSGLARHEAVNLVFTALHLGLIDSGHGRIGLSFPEFDKSLGSIVRIHGGKSDLSELLVGLTLAEYEKIVEFSELQIAPTECKHRVVRRVQPRDSSSRARRHARRGNSAVCVDGHRPTREPLKQPYVTIPSQSTSQVFRLFIEHGELLDAPVPGSFSAYGLSDRATVPWF